MFGDIFVELFDGIGFWTREVFTSSLIAAIIPSLAGAFAGAWAAKRIAETTKLRDELRKEIRNANAAVAMLYGLANSHLGLKRQHIKKMRDTYNEERGRFFLHWNARKAGSVPADQVYTFNADMQTLKPPYSPMEQIQTLIFDEISSEPAVLFVTPILIAAHQSLNESLAERNAILADWKANPRDDLAVPYFGLPKGRIVDEQYKTLVHAIYSQTDDVITLSLMIANALREYAISKRETFRKRFGDEQIKVPKFDIPTHLKDLLPPPDEGFERMFDKPPEQKLTFLERIFGKNTGLD